MIKDYNIFFERIFLFAGIYNIGAAITFIFCHKWLFPLINIVDLHFPSFMFLAFAFVFVFGIGYLIVSKDLSKLRFSIPNYLENDINLKKFISSIDPATIDDGGDGALIIKLKL